MDVAAATAAHDPAAAVDAIDRSFHAALARFTGGLSPAALALAFADWQLHLLASPGKQAALAGQALQNAMQFCRRRGAEAPDLPAVVLDQASGEGPALHGSGLGAAVFQSFSRPSC